MHKSKLNLLSPLWNALSLAVLVLLFAVIPAWAGDAGRIAFVGNQSGSFQLYTMNPDGSDMVQVTNLAATNLESWAPAISPDGQQIVFAYGTVGSNGNLLTDLYLINVDGTGLTRITTDGLSAFANWSPDGTRLVLGRLSTRTGVFTIVTMRADGTGEKTVLTSDVWDSLPAAYTPDGQRIVFYSQEGGFISTTWIMNADGSHKKRLTEAALEALPNDVSPDGQHIILTSHTNTPVTLSNNIFVVSVDGTKLKQVTRFPGLHHDVNATYSPDGNKIAFASDRLSSDGSLDIFTMNADGSDVTRIATGLTVGGCADKNCVTPRWGPKQEAHSGMISAPNVTLSPNSLIDERKSDQVDELLILTGGHCIAPSGIVDGFCIGHVGPRLCQTKQDSVHCPAGVKAKSPGVATCCTLVSCGHTPVDLGRFCNF